ncbi:MAG: 3-phosphoserine/phosphohydroxythreonine transaminase [Oscillospiraceae bacterium]|jgi:phosphoserine aminotransferase
MSRVYNFSAGPSILPESVLRRAAAELVEYGSSGQSVMEMSHRSPEFEAIAAECEERLRRVMSIPDGYKVLFLQGGASTQFAMVPLNLMGENGCADYIVTGQFAEKAAQEAQKFGTVNIVASSKDKTFSYIPELDKIAFNSNASYVHICQNNTIYGTRYPHLPDTGDIPLVADLSSCILSEPVDVSKYGLIYAGAQKNVAPAGLTIVILREDLAGKALPYTPTMLDYTTHIKSDSMYNTPPCWCIYMCSLVLDWLEHEVGGLEAMKEINQRKAKILYDFLDSSKLFQSPVVPQARSMMNVTFVTGDPALDKEFVSQAAKQGLRNIKGHRSVGGMRASIYNAMPQAGVEALVKFMAEFEKSHS